MGDRVVTRRGATGVVLALSFALLGCDDDSNAKRPGDDMAVLPGSSMRDDAGTEPDGGGVPLDGPAVLYESGGGLDVGTVAGGVLMTSPRYRMFGATGQSPGNEVTSSNGNFDLRSGVVGVTP